jgi:hypothetical protein
VKQLIKRTAIVLALVSGFLLGACSDGSSLPDATGKAEISAINAIYGSPDLTFLIEERSIGAVPYKQRSTTASYDDLDYTFNFDVFFAGNIELIRIASHHIDFVADQTYTILATGTVAAPILTVWESTKREFAATDTVFQARFSHTSNSLGAIDVYFALAGVAPVLGQEVASLSFGGISAEMDFETDDYILTITASGDPTDILLESAVTTVPSQIDLIVTPFDGDANNTAPIVARGLVSTGGTIPFSDPLFPAALQFLHAARDLHVGVGADLTDIYEDEALLSRVVAGIAYRELTAPAPVLSGDYVFSYTPAGDTSVVTLASPYTIAQPLNYRITVGGGNGVYVTTNVVLDHRAVDTAVKLLYSQLTNNFQFTNLYLVEAGTLIEGQVPFLSAVNSGQTSVHEIAPGSYDVYITEFGETEIFAGPFRLDAALGDVFDMVVYDTDDPVVQDIVLLPNL